MQIIAGALLPHFLAKGSVIVVLTSICRERSDDDKGTLAEYMKMKPPLEPSEQPTSVKMPSSETLKFSKKWLALAFVIAGVSDAIGAFATPLPPIGWVVDIGTALLLFMVLGRQWMLLPGIALKANPGLGVLPFWLLVVAAIAVLGTPRPKFERH